MSVAYVICAAGEGSRFHKDFGSLPKSLIKLCGHTLLEWSLRSLPVFADDRLIFITQTKHRLKEKCFEMVKDLYPFNEIEWVEIPTLTRGQLETAYLAKKYVRDNDSLVIYNCDTYFQSKQLEQLFNGFCVRFRGLSEGFDLTAVALEVCFIGLNIYQVIDIQIF